MTTRAACAECGRPVLRDDETGAEAHLDPTRRDACGVERELAPLVARMEGRETARRPHLRIVR